MPLWYDDNRQKHQRRYSFGDRDQFEDGYTYPSMHYQRKQNTRSSPFLIDRLDSVDSAENFDSDFSFLHPQSNPAEEKLRKITACDQPSSCQDGLLDVVSVRSAFHLGQIHVGLSHAQRICQCHEAIVTNKKAVAVQVDGEPWKQKGHSSLKITRKKDPAKMLHRAANDGGGAETEMAKLLDWAEERNIIDKEVHGT